MSTDASSCMPLSGLAPSYKVRTKISDVVVLDELEVFLIHSYRKTNSLKF